MYTVVDISRMQTYGPSFSVEIVSLTFVIALGACISVGLLLGWHIYLVATNQVSLTVYAVFIVFNYVPIYQTTIEFYVNIENRMDAKQAGIEYKNPFDEGYSKNFARLLGTSPWYSNFLPFLNMPPPPLYPLQVMPGVLNDGSINV